MMSKYRADDITTVKNGLRIMREICNNYTDECGDCQLRVRGKGKDSTATWCIMADLPCDWLDDDIDNVFTE